MERKIGEIFEYKGEWYQCVESDSCGECSLFTTECGSGTKSDLADKIFGQCSRVRRSDNKHVIFKKLEKVGEPMKIHNRLVLKVKADAYMCMRCCFYSKGKCELTMQECEYYDCGEENKFIEIKQNKEDMEEKKFCEETSKANEVNMIFKIASKYINGNITYDEFGEAIRNWINGSEKDEHILKEFDLEASKAGKPVCTRDERKARIICFDRKGNTPIVALIECVNHTEILQSYHNDGKCFHYETSNSDLMMLPEKKEGWVNLYKSSAHSTKEEAMKYRNKCNDYIDMIKIEWEE